MTWGGMEAPVEIGKVQALLCLSSGYESRSVTEAALLVSGHTLTLRHTPIIERPGGVASEEILTWRKMAQTPVW